jgi:hypothetical protein
MDFWGFSLIIAMNFLGLQQQAHAQEDRESPGKGASKPATAAATGAPEQTSVTDASAAAAPGTSTVSDTPGLSITTSQIFASSSSSSPSPDLGFFPTEWASPTPNFSLGQLGTMGFLIEAATLGSSFNVSGIAIYVCQTSAPNGELPSSRNTWAVAQVPRMYPNLCWASNMADVLSV